MAKRHATIETFNTTYGTNAENFDALLNDRILVDNLPADHTRAMEDDRAFVALLADHYYTCCTNAIRNHDDQHLILGETFEGNRGIPDEVLDAAARHIDVLCVQLYGMWRDHAPMIDRWHKRSGKPILLADSCYALATDEMPRPCGVRVKSQAARADAFEQYARAALACPHIVGWFWCGYMDQYQSIEPRRQHTGLQDPWGKPHRALTDRMQKVFREMVHITPS